MLAAKPVSWLLFSDGPMTEPCPVAIGEGPHRMQRVLGFTEGQHGCSGLCALFVTLSSSLI